MNAEHERESAHAEGAQYLSFLLGDAEYGLDILHVQEIRGWTGATPLPSAPDHVRGVINLRGAIVPVIDLRTRFGLEQREYDETTVVIVVRTGEPGNEYTMGVVVDAVADVYRVPAEDLSAAPSFGSGAHAELASALATIGDKLVIVLDIERVLGGAIAIDERVSAEARRALEGQ